jgi:hypothetical protein
MLEPRPTITHQGKLWILRLRSRGGVQEYRCASEEAARHLEELFDKPPCESPPPPANAHGPAHEGR